MHLFVYLFRPKSLLHSQPSPVTYAQTNVQDDISRQTFNCFHWGPSTISPMAQDVIQESLCLFIYLEQKVYYIVNTLLSPMHRQLSMMKYQHRLLIGVLFSIKDQDIFQESLILSSEKINLTKKIKKIILPKKNFFFTKKNVFFFLFFTRRVSH